MTAKKLAATRFFAPWMGMAPLVTVLGALGIWPEFPAWVESGAVWGIGLMSLAALFLLVRECLHHAFRSVRSALLLES